MNTALKAGPTAGSLGPLVVEWGPILAGLAALYVPTYISLGETIWQSDEQAHGPIILLVVLWLLWKKHKALAALARQAAPVSGWVVLLVGLFSYVLGRSQDILLFEIGSQIVVLGGTLLIMRGWAAVGLVSFALLFIVFMIPLPAPLVDAVTGPLKHNVSLVAETLLYAAGYPIARSGVVLTIGQYQLLVADACSGLNSMFSLSALGLLYLHLMQYKTWWHNALLLVSILPIAFCANIVRVVILVLVTYYFGDEAGQGFVHGFAGMVLFVAALLMLFGLDSLLHGLERLLPNQRA